MCGIVGYTNKKENKEDIIKKMAQRLNHRGPDGEGYYIDEEVAIGHKRLAIIDLEKGNQPMISQDGNIIITYNGEIYNYQELKKELEAKCHNFVTNSDTEVLIHGFEEWRYDLPKHLRGMFAFAIWDKINKELFLSVDYFGVKPLYYCTFNDTFMFSSEIKAFLEHPDFSKEFNEAALFPYLTFGFNPLDEAFFKNVYQLNPGTSLIVKEQKITKIKYFQLNFVKEKEISKEEIKNVVNNSLKAHLQSDVMISSFLSSGVDSSYIVSAVKPKVTYTIGYENKKYSEIDYAQNLAELLNIQNKSKIISKEEYMQNVAKVMYYLDEPSSDASIISLYLLVGFASKDVKVILSGEGADEFFGGYNTYQELTNSYLHIPYSIRNLVARVLSYFPEFKGRNFLVRNGETIERRYASVGNLFSQKECQKILKEKGKITIANITNEIIKESGATNDLEKMQAVDIRFWLFKDILRKGDRMTMANSLELRVPFIDKEVFNIAKNLKIEEKVSKTMTKVKYREAAKDVIPNKAYLKKKLGFPVPIHDWLQDEILIQEIKNAYQEDWVQKYFKQEKIIKLLKKPQKNYKKIWGIYAFIKWYDIYFNNL